MKTPPCFLTWLGCLIYQFKLRLLLQRFQVFSFHKGVDRTLGGGRLGVLGVPGGVVQLPGVVVDPVDGGVHTAP